MHRIILLFKLIITLTNVFPCIKYIHFHFIPTLLSNSPHLTSLSSSPPAQLSKFSTFISQSHTRTFFFLCYHHHQPHHPSIYPFSCLLTSFSYINFIHSYNPLFPTTHFLLRSLRLVLQHIHPFLILLYHITPSFSKHNPFPLTITTITLHPTIVIMIISRKAFISIHPVSKLMLRNVHISPFFIRLHFFRKAFYTIVKGEKK